MAEGNPSNSLIRAQATGCTEILKAEIGSLKPTHILMEIDESWLSRTSRGKEIYNFMNIFENATDRSDIIPKGQKIVQKAFISNDIKVIVSCRPERLSREVFSETIVQVFSKM
jgi:hypothetical protein